MSDQSIQYDEEMVGAGHPTKSDTLNRLALVEHANDGNHTVVSLDEQSAAPSNTADHGKLYTKDADGITELFYLDSAGNEIQLTSGGALMAGSKSIQYVTKSINIGATGNETATIASVDPDKCKVWPLTGPAVQGGTVLADAQVTDATTLTIYKRSVSGYNDPTYRDFTFLVIEEF